MTYRSDFYNLQNIIGYTGSVRHNPTVYFRCERMGLVGRITQAHAIQDNIGRSKPYSIAGYDARNEWNDGASRYVERVNGRIVHRSRNIFVRVGRLAPNAPGGGLDLAALSLIAQAIWRFPYAKDCVYREIHFGRYARAKCRAMAELRDIASLSTPFVPSQVAIHAQITDVI